MLAGSNFLHQYFFCFIALLCQHDLAMDRSVFSCSAFVSSMAVRNLEHTVVAIPISCISFGMNAVLLKSDVFINYSKQFKFLNDEEMFFNTVLKSAVFFYAR